MNAPSVAVVRQEVAAWVAGLGAGQDVAEAVLRVMDPLAGFAPSMVHDAVEQATWTMRPSFGLGTAQERPAGNGPVAGCADVRCTGLREGPPAPCECARRMLDLALRVGLRVVLVDGLGAQAGRLAEAVFTAPRCTVRLDDGQVVMCDLHDLVPLVEQGDLS